MRAAKGGTVKLPIKAAGKGLKGSNEKGKLKAKLKIAYSPGRRRRQHRQSAR